MKMQLPILMGIALLLAVSLVLGAYLVIYNHDYEIEMDELEIHLKEYKNGVLTVTVSSTLEGQFLYSVSGDVNEDGNYELTFYGGKQSSLAQNPGNAKAVFAVEIPAGYGKVVCGNTTLHNLTD